MKKTKLVLDSTSGYDLFEHPYDAEILRLSVIHGDDQYTDGETIKPDAFYKLLKEHPEILPSTSQPTVGKTVEQFNRLKSEGYTDLIVLTISSKLSGTYATTVSAAEMVDGINVHVVDTLSTAIPVYQMGQIAANMIAREKEPAEIVEHIESIKSEYSILLAVGDLTLLKKNGRLSTASAMIGQVLKVKPLLELSKEGVIETLQKVRTMKKALGLLLDTYNDRSIHTCDVTILHSDAMEDAKYVQDKLMELYPELGSVEIYGLSPVIGSHVGIGTVALTFRKRSKG